MRSTIYNQIGRGCVRVCLHYAPHQYTGSGVERGNDVHEALSLITRFASVAAARTIVVCRPLLSIGVRMQVCLHQIVGAMHSASVGASVLAGRRLSLNYE